MNSENGVSPTTLSPGRILQPVNVSPIQKCPNPSEKRPIISSVLKRKRATADVSVEGPDSPKIQRSLGPDSPKFQRPLIASEKPIHSENPFAALRMLANQAAEIQRHIIPSENCANLHMLANLTSILEPLPDIQQNGKNQWCPKLDQTRIMQWSAPKNTQIIRESPGNGNKGAKGKVIITLDQIH